jgi:hypothetical protein
MKRNRRYNKWGYAYANGFVVLAESLDMFRLGLLTLAGVRNRQAICPLRKELWLAGYLGVEPREMGSLWLRALTLGRSSQREQQDAALSLHTGKKNG